MISANEDSVIITFSPETSKYWQYISDRTMGGVSDGQAVLEQDENKFVARLIGSVSTKNNGGFIQLRSSVLFDNLKRNNTNIKGIRLKVRGNSEVYHIFIRTNETRSYRDYYLASFTANSNWEMIDLPLNKFKHRVTKNSNLDSKELRTFAIVAYGRDFESDISISEIIFYY
tara:strand:- start:1455 stop:1970 length:516 start_codon:yes stop_codon:yes gene_type:complete